MTVSFKYFNTIPAYCKTTAGEGREFGNINMYVGTVRSRIELGISAESQATGAEKLNSSFPAMFSW